MKETHQPLTDAVFYILLALRRPNHGYGVVQQVEQMIQDEKDNMQVTAGTISVQDAIVQAFN